MFGSVQNQFKRQFKNFKGQGFTAALHCWVPEPTGQLALWFAADWFRWQCYWACYRAKPPLGSSLAVSLPIPPVTHCPSSEGLGQQPRGELCRCWCPHKLPLWSQVCWWEVLTCQVQFISCSGLIRSNKAKHRRGWWAQLPLCQDPALPTWDLGNNSLRQPLMLTSIPNTVHAGDFSLF